MKRTRNPRTLTTRELAWWPASCTGGVDGGARLADTPPRCRCPCPCAGQPLLLLLLPLLFPLCWHQHLHRHPRQQQPQPQSQLPQQRHQPCASRAATAGRSLLVPPPPTPDRACCCRVLLLWLCRERRSCATSISSPWSLPRCPLLSRCRVLGGHRFFLSRAAAVACAAEARHEHHRASARRHAPRALPLHRCHLLHLRPDRPRRRHDHPPGRRHRRPCHPPPARRRRRRRLRLTR
jgi:hypothetical protein